MAPTRQAVGSLKNGFEWSGPTTPGQAATGLEINQMSDEELSDRMERIPASAQVEPMRNLRIVNAMKPMGYAVAVTVDGVNDGPARLQQREIVILPEVIETR